MSKLRPSVHTDKVRAGRTRWLKVTIRGVNNDEGYVLFDHPSLFEGDLGLQCDIDDLWVTSPVQKTSKGEEDALTP